MCRASLLNGMHTPHRDDLRHDGNAGGNTTNNNNANNNGPGVDPGDLQPQAQQPPNNQQPNNAGERALFRFSTEGILPEWLPIPAFSFEVVRRENQAAAPNPNPDGLQRFLRRGGEVEANTNDTNNNNNNQDGRPQQSFWRRILAGAIPMSLEEEALAIEQLVGKAQCVLCIAFMQPSRVTNASFYCCFVVTLQICFLSTTDLTC